MVEGRREGGREGGREVLGHEFDYRRLQVPGKWQLSPLRRNTRNNDGTESLQNVVAAEIA